MVKVARFIETMVKSHNFVALAFRVVFLLVWFLLCLSLQTRARAFRFSVPTLVKPVVSVADESRPSSGGTRRAVGAVPLTSGEP